MKFTVDVFIKSYICGLVRLITMRCRCSKLTCSKKAQEFKVSRPRERKSNRDGLIDW